MEDTKKEVTAKKIPPNYYYLYECRRHSKHDYKLREKVIISIIKETDTKREKYIGVDKFFNMS